MHDYMKALYHRFEAPSRRMEYMDRKIKRTHSQLARLLGKSEKKLLLRIADMEDELRDEACLNSFISGFRLAHPAGVAGRPAALQLRGRRRVACL